MLETKTKINKILVAIISAGVVLFNAIPAFASSATDYDTITSQQLLANIGLPYASYVISDGMYELKVPVVMRFSNPLPTGDTWKYMSGYARYNIAPTAFTINTNTPVNITVAYFEPIESENLRVVWNTSSVLRIYFDNFRVNSASTAYQFINLGYIVYHFQMPSSTFTMSFDVANVSNNVPTASNVRLTEYEYGFVSAMVSAINSASSIEDIFEVLNSIDQNTGYLADILAELQDTHTELYYLLAQIWNTDTAVLGVDRDIYNTVLSIFALLNNAYAPQESHAEEVADNIEQNMSNLAHDIELTKPSQVANIADDYINQIDTSYNTSIFGALFNPIIILMLCVVFAFAILSYMLYGGS